MDNISKLPIDTRKSVAVFLAEVVRVDFKVTEEDLSRAAEGLCSILGGDPVDARKLIEEALLVKNRPVSYHPFAEELNRQFDYERKLNLINWLWEVATVDDEIDKYEDHVIRKFADLLHVKQVDLLSSKRTTSRRNS